MALSPAGIAFAAAILLPNLLLLAFPPVGRAPTPSVPAVAVLAERVGQVLVLAALVLSGPDRPPDAWFWLAVAAIAAYLALWVRYLASGRTPRAMFQPVAGIPVPMAIAPILAFLATAAWSRSVWLAAATLVFAAGHLVVSLSTWRRLSRAGGTRPEG